MPNSSSVAVTCGTALPTFISDVARSTSPIARFAADQFLDGLICEYHLAE
ncbi:MAG: hypothetical protein JOZ09_09695 [Pseudonocardiales bacterium]|nr:hypothetical protein [Pseudonocardiales bacterium]